MIGVLRRHRVRVWATLSAWAALAAVDLADAFGAIGALPINLHVLATGGCVALTTLAVVNRNHSSLRAAFLDGMLHERVAGGPTQELPVLHAVGDGGAPVVRLSSALRRPSPRGAHRR
jgi:hypothetical protein